MSPRQNRLAEEASPYLLQHRHNPVDWYPWGREALEKARREDKPVFLSVGYAACHWCHVMERESFESEPLAELLNEHFVPVKVDREERPDIDEIYMHAVQAMTGRGGWPMSVFLTPDGRPFWGGTYFPPRDQGGMVGFESVLQGLAHSWREKRDEIEETADQLAEALRRSLGATPGGGELTWSQALDRAVRDLESRFDEEWGGWGTPKFPHADAVSLLLLQAERTGRGELAEMARKSLDEMDRGGIHDQVGGGFHRYAVDQRWLVPHFEKMLYDQALLVEAYVDALLHTGDECWGRPALDTCLWVLREMVDDEGGLHASLDADSEGEEGLFYLWSPEELREVLRQAEVDTATIERYLRWYALTGPANFEGRWILHRPMPLEAFALQERVEEREWRETWSGLDEKVRVAREGRVRPAKDDKVLAGWNGLMIAALARAGAALEEPELVEAAARAAGFVLGEMRPDGRLHRAWCRGRLGEPAFLEDHAFLARGLLELEAATGEDRWLAEARELVDETVRLFWDEEDGGFFFTGSDGENLILRSKAAYDGATPAGASVMVEVLLRLAELDGDEGLRARALETLALYRGAIEKYPGGYATMLRSVDRLAREDAPAEGSAESGQAGEEAPERSLLARGLTLTAADAGTLRAGEATEIVARIELAEGWSLPATGGAPGLSAPVLELSPAAEGWALEEITWPEPASASTEDGPFETSVPAHEGVVEVRAVLRAPEDAEPGPWEVPLVLRAQVCSATECTPPGEAVAAVAVEVES